MNKHLILFGIVVLLICIGLSGCVLQQDDVITDFEYLYENSDEYIGKNVTLKGVYNGLWYLNNSLLNILLDNGVIQGYASENVNTSNLIWYERYLWTGVIEPHETRKIIINLTDIKPVEKKS